LISDLLKALKAKKKFSNKQVFEKQFNEIVIQDQIEVQTNDRK